MNYFKLLCLSLLSALLLCFSFPKWNFEFLAWFALVPLLLGTESLSIKKTFLMGWLTGILAFCGILYWIVPTFQAAEVSVWIGMLSLLLLSAYLGLYYGLFLAVQNRYFRNFPESVYAVAFIALWVAFEYLRSFLFTGFPWALLGYCQWKYYSIAQMAEWTGVYGVSAMILSGNFVIWRWIRNRKVQWGTFVPLVFFLFFTILSFPREAKLRPAVSGNAVVDLRQTKTMDSSFGWNDNQEKQENEFRKQHSLTIAILQGSIDQYKKWSPQYVQEILDSYGGLCKDLTPSLIPKPKSSSIDLVIWPETAVPGWVPNDESLVQWIQQTIRPTKTAHLIGAVTRSIYNNYNSAFLFSADGKILDRYDKIHLVPFGEFVPFQSFLGQRIPVLNQLGGFQAGTDREVLKIGNALAGVNICYEAIFPHLVRRQVQKGAEFLVNITNDGWYLDTAAPEQHFSMNVFRAIENRRFVVRAANTGISGVIDPSGQVIQRTELNRKTLVIDKINTSRKRTFYTKFGDIFAWGCCLFAVFCLSFPRSSAHAGRKRES